MPAYIICMVNVTDPEQYRKYIEGAGPATAKNGGRFLARGGEQEVLEGNLEFQRVVIAEFDDMDAARRHYHSPEYQAARQNRLGAADFHAVLISAT
jgi:uncharacterized protein (DUF1330 family)